MAKILLVEDDWELSNSCKDWLAHELHVVETLVDGKEAAHRLKMYKYDVIVLDWDLPSLSGLDVCQQYRADGGAVPILMMTGKDTIDDKTKGLDSGADDYITKPFHLRELSARIRALLRRPSIALGSKLKVGTLELDPQLRQVFMDGNEIQLLPREFALLEFLMRHQGEVFSPEHLLNRVWSSESESSINTVYTYIKTLRRKISQDGVDSPIVNVHGVGYKLMGD